MKKIYLLNSCDEWKSYASMSLIMASTSLRKIKSEIKKQIKQGKMLYNNGNENISKTSQINMLKLDFKNNEEQFVFNNLEYGFINIVNDGEEQ